MKNDFEYMSASELKELTGMSIEECRRIIKKSREIMKQKNYYVPISRPLLASKKVVKEVLGC